MMLRAAEFRARHDITIGRAGAGGRAYYMAGAAIRFRWGFETGTRRASYFRFTATPAIRRRTYAHC